MIGINLQLFDVSTEQASITGIQAVWWDIINPKHFVNPLGQSGVITTDVDGYINLDLSEVTELSIGDYGFLLLYKSDDTDSEDALVFAGQVQTSNIGSGEAMTPLGGYNFYTIFNLIYQPVDLVSEQPLITVLDAGRYDYDGDEYDTDEPIITIDGLLSNGAYSQLVPYSEDTSNWTGSGPWTQSINLGNTGIYTISTDLDGATVDITAGTATIDGSAQATFGSPDQFEVTGAGTITITTDIADPKAQLTLSPYVLPYSINTTSGTLSVPLNYSDADEGNKWPINSTDTPQLLDALDGAADGSELVTNGDFDTDTSDWTNSQVTATVSSGEVTVVALDGESDRIEQTINITINKYYELTIRAKRGSQGTNQAVRFGDQIDTIDIDSSEFEIYKLRFTSTETAGKPLLLYAARISGSAGDELIVDWVKLKEISPAQGKMTVEWTPRFDAADVSGQINILTVNDTAVALLYYDADTNQLKAYDGVNTAVVACTPVDGTEYQIILDYGDDSGQKMRLTVDVTAGSQVTHEGAFPIVDDLSVAWEADAPQYIGEILIEKESIW